MAGYQLRKVQSDLMPDDFKPMRSVGPGVQEIRIRTDQAHRVFYIAKFEESIYVLHAFEKKARRTSQADIEMGRKRLAEAIRHRTNK